MPMLARMCLCLQIAVEGNIASGKSSFLEYLSNQKNTEVLYEPLKEWQTLEGGNLIVSHRPRVELRVVEVD